MKSSSKPSKRLLISGLFLFLGFVALGSLYTLPTSANGQASNSLTQDEQAWLRHLSSPLTVGITEIPNQILKDGHAGYRGFSIELFDKISNVLHVPFQYVYFDTWNQLIEAAKKHQVDIVFSAQKTPSRLAYLYFTDTVLSQQNKIIVHVGTRQTTTIEDLAHRKVAVAQSSAIYEYIKFNYPDVLLLGAKNELDALSMVEHHKADAAISEAVRASYYIEKNNLNDLRIASSLEYDYHLSIASRNDWPMLNVVLSKAVAAIPSEQIEAMQLKWGYVKDQVTLFDKQTLIYIAIALGVIFGIILPFSIYLYRVNQKLQSEIRTRKQLWEERANLAKIVEQSLNAIILTDRDGVIEYVNPAFEQMSGYSKDEAVGQKPNIVKSGQHAASYYQDMWDTLLRGESWQDNFINKAKDGHFYEVEQTIFPIVSKSQGKITGYTSIQQDITERKRMQRQDEHAQRLESLGTLAGGIAHDFNNLLGVIMGHANLIQCDLSNEQANEQSLEHILNASENAAKLCQQMLAYSGKGRFVIHPISLSSVVVNMLQLLETSVHKKAQLQLALEDDLPLVEADEGQMQQIIMNLVTNASEAMDEHGGEILITTTTTYVSEEQRLSLLNGEHISAGNYVSLQVKDNGCGMDLETQKKIFDPFFTTKFTGRGLSMSATLGIVRGHRGALKVTSALHQGTTISIYLPMVEKKQATQATSPDALPSTEQPSQPATPLSATVLIIDDEKDLREVASHLLKSLGMQCLQAESGEEGLELLRQHGNDIDVILLDMTMPHMDGQQFYTHMQDIAPDMPVIVSSGYAESDIRRRFESDMPAHATLAFLQKPYRPDDLRAKIQHILKHHKN